MPNNVALLSMSFSAKAYSRKSRPTCGTLQLPSSFSVTYAHWWQKKCVGVRAACTQIGQTNTKKENQRKAPRVNNGGAVPRRCQQQSFRKKAKEPLHTGNKGGSRRRHSQGATGCTSSGVSNRSPVSFCHRSVGEKGVWLYFAVVVARLNTKNKCLESADRDSIDHINWVLLTNSHVGLGASHNVGAARAPRTPMSSTARFAAYAHASPPASRAAASRCLLTSFASMSCASLCCDPSGGDGAWPTAGTGTGAGTALPAANASQLSSCAPSSPSWKLYSHSPSPASRSASIAHSCTIRGTPETLAAANSKGTVKNDDATSLSRMLRVARTHGSEKASAPASASCACIMRSPATTVTSSTAPATTDPDAMPATSAPLLCRVPSPSASM
mmetsp:Transcript_12294/g.38242  ORF Transcript_12294/g.38242 Transcript_12294/m.38242 type:complete len:386 (+) Transcript_12294:246-1403(+)